MFFLSFFLQYRFLKQDIERQTKKLEKKKEEK